MQDDPFGIKSFSVRSHNIFDENCNICGSSKNVEIHDVKHIRKGKVIGFSQIMKKLNRIPVCRDCHMKIHSGKYDGINLSSIGTINN